VVLGIDSRVTLAEELEKPAHVILRGRIDAWISLEGNQGFIKLTPMAGMRAPNGDRVALEIVAEGKAYMPLASPLTIWLSHIDPFDFFSRGDSNIDGQHDIADAVFTLNWLFGGSPDPQCPDANDANDDGSIDISDPIFSLGCLFLGTPCPPFPFPECGLDFTEDALRCDIIGVQCL